MTYKKQLKQNLKLFLNKIADKCKQSRLSQKSIGIIIRTAHMCTPVNCVFLLLFAPKIWCTIIIYFLVTVMIMFYTFDCCFLSILEKELCNDDFTILDPPLELLHLETNTQNRYFISNILGITYMSFICFVYYVRFYSN
jgi:hypothetical protein